MTTEIDKSESELRARVNGNNVILDKLIYKLQLKNDAALARTMEVAPPVISKLRHARLPFGASYIIRAHELTDWPIAQIKEWLGHKSVRQAA